ncbi:MAG: aminoacyl-histidine dipeptidase [Rikenellaceae bacterium]
MDITQLQPQLLWRYFDIITSIPRPSGSEEAIIGWLIEQANDHNLAYKRDSAGNLLIEAPATNGLENSSRITMQAHVDMVCEKSASTTHDFMKDPIETYIEDGWIKARGTTLGADCGIGVAAALAALTDPELEHGPLEALFSVDEERGLSGAFGLGEEMINGKYLLNLDSEDEGEIFIGCAGGIDTTAHFEIEREELPEGMRYLKVSIGGLQGGHSGDDINKGRANAVKILSRLLFEASLTIGARIIDMECGNLRNAIPREGWATIAIEKCAKSSFEALFLGYNTTIKNEFQLLDPGVELTLETIDHAPQRALSFSDTFTILGSLVALPNGVMEMSQVMEGLVDSSSNLAAVHTHSDHVVVLTSQRSSTIEGRERVKNQVATSFTAAKATINHSTGYPGWSPNPDSELLKKAIASYKELFGEEPKVRAIHAGLECGLFLESYPNLDMISFGPTMRGVHSPDERLEIASVERFWSYLVAIIKSI